MPTTRPSFYTSLVFAFLTLFSCFTHKIYAQNTGRKAYNDAEKLRQAGNCKEALTEYEAAIAKEGDNYRYFFGKARCEYDLDDFRSAKRSLERVLEFNKNFTSAYSMLARIYRMEKDYDNAIFYYKEASVVETDSVRKLQYHLLVISLLMNEKRIREAREMLISAKKLDTEHPGVMYYQAELFLQENNWEQAKEIYLAALSSSRMQTTPPKEKAKYYFSLGLAYNRMGEREKAEEAWEKAKFGPYQDLIEKEKQIKNDEEYYKIAVSYYLQGEYKESEGYLQKALELNEEFVNAYVLKGRIAEKQGRMDDAVIAYQQAISSESDDNKAAKIRVMEAAIHLNNEHGERALSALDPAVARFPSNTEWQYMRARATYLANQFPQAIQTLEALLSDKNLEEQTKAQYNFLLGMSAKKMGAVEKAKAAFQNAFYGPYRDAARVELEGLERN